VTEKKNPAELKLNRDCLVLRICIGYTSHTVDTNIDSKKHLHTAQSAEYSHN
jgi:hypothetical protein